MNKVLFIMHMPPPVHGAAVVGKNIHDSKTINETFECIYINPSASANINEVGKISLHKIFFLYSLLAKIYKTIKKEHPDLCYYTPTTSGWGIYRDALTIKLIKWAGCEKVLLHIHNKGVKPNSRNTLRRLTYNSIFKNNKVILLAKELKDDISMFAKDEQISLCPNGMPLNISEVKAQEVIQKRKPISKKPYILYLGNMMNEKGIWILLHACLKLKEKNIDFECHYIGNWGDTTYDEFHTKIVDYGLENYVTAHGPKYDKEKFTYFCNANLFVFPTFYSGETFGLVLLEAMEFALPCISTYEGGIPSIIENNKTGILCKQKDVNDLTDKICYLINNENKAIEIGLMGRNAFLEKFSLNIFEKNLCNIIKQAISSN